MKPPLHLTIPYPNKYPQFGLFAVREIDMPISVRLSRIELRDIRRAAKQCGMSTAGFLRQSAAATAEAVLRSKNEGE